MTTSSNVKIYFCDICNQSIPLKDLDEGQAVAVKGKLLCASCNAVAVSASKGAAAAPLRTGSAIGGAPSLLLLVAVAAVGGGLWALVEHRAKGLHGEIETLRTSATDQDGTFGDRLQKQADELTALRARIGDQEAALRTAREDLEARRANDQADVEARFEKVQGYVEENERLKDRVRQTEIGLAAALDTQAGLLRGATDFQMRLNELQTRQPAGPAPGPAPIVPEGAPANGDGLPPLPAELQQHVKRLDSNDPGERWDAVSELGRRGNDKVVPYLIPKLKDVDEFVRLHAAEVLGDLDAKSAVPALIDALADETSFVREMVYSQLRKITRVTNLKFDPDGKKEDRQRQQKAWQSWWDQQQPSGGAKAG